MFIAIVFQWYTDFNKWSCSYSVHDKWNNGTDGYARMRTVPNHVISNKIIWIVRFLSESKAHPKPFRRKCDKVFKLKINFKKTVTFKRLASTLYFWHKLISQMKCLRKLELKKSKNRTRNYQKYFQAGWEIRHEKDERPPVAFVVEPVATVPKAVFLILKKTRILKIRLLQLF